MARNTGTPESPNPLTWGELPGLPKISTSR
jgi:hypothetical protein